MSLEELNLDNLEFQRDFVDKARLQIYQLSPEWTDYNVSDPGIMLIEFFSWMAEQMLYRLNQVPEENLITFLALLGAKPTSTLGASTELTFYLSTPFPTASLPGGERPQALEEEPKVLVTRGTEVTTRQAEQEKAISFTTNDNLTIKRPLLRHLVREGGKNYLESLRKGEEFTVFKPKPDLEDCFYLGFDPAHPLAGYVLELKFECAATLKPNISLHSPPLVWECSLGNGKWAEVFNTSQGEVPADSTGGLTYERGSLVLSLPRLMAPNDVDSCSAYWLRCSYKQRHPEQGWYVESPRLKNIEAAVLGACIDASHAMIVKNEFLGTSDGRASQRFFLKHAPALKFEIDKGERVEVEEELNGQKEFVPWTSVESFASSTRHDRHFMLDSAKGEIRFGPPIRQPNGEIKQHGRVPEPTAHIRVSQYRYGGGYQGNVRANQIQQLKRRIDYIDRVTNLEAATGGRDQENLEEAKMRVLRDIHAQERAVTALDYETLALRDEKGIGRIKCLTGNEGLPLGTIELLAVPNVVDALHEGKLSALTVDYRLKQKIKQKLDPYRLLTTNLLVREPRYLGIQLNVKVVPEASAWPHELQDQVRQVLNAFLTPLPPRDQKEASSSSLMLKEASNELSSEEEALHKDGWPFGKELYLADIYSQLLKVSGLKHVKEIKVKTRLVIPSREKSEESTNEKLVALPNDERSVKLEPDMLICSLKHNIEIVEF